MIKSKNQWLKDREEIKVYEQKVQEAKEEVKTQDPENRGNYDKKIRSLQQENNTLKKSLQDINKSKEAIALKIHRENSAKETFNQQKEEASNKLRDLLSQLANKRDENKKLIARIEESRRELGKADEEKREAGIMYSTMKQKLERLIDREQFKTPNNLNGGKKQDIETLRKCLDYKLEKMYKIV